MRLYELSALAQQWRTAQETEWSRQRTPGKPASWNQCEDSMRYVTHALRQEHGVSAAFMVGLVVFANTDIDPIDGHVWSIVSTDEGDAVVDLTPDQTGYTEPYICDTPANLQERGIYYRAA